MRPAPASGPGRPRPSPGSRPRGRPSAWTASAARAAPGRAARLSIIGAAPRCLRGGRGASAAAALLPSRVRPRAALRSGSGPGVDRPARDRLGAAASASLPRRRPRRADSSWERSELHGSRKPERVSVDAMGGTILDAGAGQGCCGHLGGGVGCGGVARGTSGRIPVVPPGGAGARAHRAPGLRLADGSASAPGRRPRPPPVGAVRTGRVRRRSTGGRADARPVRPRPARPPDLGHRPVQLPLPVLHAGGGVRARLRVPAQGARSCRSRRSPGSRRCSWGSGVGKLRITGGEPLVRRDLPVLDRRRSRRSGAPTASRSTSR